MKQFAAGDLTRNTGDLFEAAAVSPQAPLPTGILAQFHHPRIHHLSKACRGGGH